MRQGRAIAWIAEAPDGVHDKFSDQQFRQLVLSVRATVGLEALVWLIDVVRRSRADAVALMRWSDAGAPSADDQGSGSNT